jgi:hypothetical protein
MLYLVRYNGFWTKIDGLDYCHSYIWSTLYFSSFLSVVGVAAFTLQISCSALKWLTFGNLENNKNVRKAQNRKTNKHKPFCSLVNYKIEVSLLGLFDHKD